MDNENKRSTAAMLALRQMIDPVLMDVAIEDAVEIWPADPLRLRTNADSVARRGLLWVANPLRAGHKQSSSRSSRASA